MCSHERRENLLRAVPDRAPPEYTKTPPSTVGLSVIVAKRLEDRDKLMLNVAAQVMAVASGRGDMLASKEKVGEKVEEICLSRAVSARHAKG